MGEQQTEDLWASSVLQTLYDYQKEGRLCDYKLASVDGPVVPIHKCVLSATCPMLHLDASGVYVMDCSKQVLLSLVNLIYTGQLRANASDVESVFAIASQVGIMLQNIPVIPDEIEEEEAVLIKSSTEDGLTIPSPVSQDKFGTDDELTSQSPISQSPEVMPKQHATRSKSTSKTTKGSTPLPSSRSKKGKDSDSLSTPVNSASGSPIRRSSRKTRGKNPLRDTLMESFQTPSMIKIEPQDDAENTEEFSMDFEMSLVLPDADIKPVAAFPCRYCSQCFAVQAVRTRHERQHTDKTIETKQEVKKSQPQEESVAESEDNDTPKNVKEKETAVQVEKDKSHAVDEKEQDIPGSPKTPSQSPFKPDEDNQVKSPSKASKHAKSTGGKTNVKANVSKNISKVSKSTTKEGTGKSATKRSGKRSASKHPRKCPICSQVLSSADCLKSHMSAVHQGIRPHQCNYCGKTFTQRAHLREHTTSHTGEKPFNCKECGQRFRLRKTYMSHLARHKEEDGQEYKCGSCIMVFSTKQRRDLHERRHGRKFVCAKCGKILRSAASLKGHMLFLHTDSRPFQCSICDKAFKQKSHLTEHEASHGVKKPFVCSTCGKGFMTQKVVNQHEEKCTVKTPAEKLQARTCPKCNKVFANEKSLKRHHYKLHVNSSGFLCSDCGKTLTTADTLRKHKEVVHQGLRNFPCETCGKYFTQKSHLTEHIRIHTGERPYQCNICGKSFSHLKNMQTHNLVHTGERPFRCDLCTMAFKQKSALKAHSKIHTKERPFACEYCGKTFPMKQSRDSHERTHTGERPFKCKFCEKCFSRSCNLGVHERLHTGQQPIFSCTQCGLTFNAKYRYRKHMKLVHGVTFPTSRRPRSELITGDESVIVKTDGAGGVVLQVLETGESGEEQTVTRQVVFQQEESNALDMVDAEAAEVIEVPQELIGDGENIVVKEETMVGSTDDPDQTYYLVYEVPVDGDGEITVESNTVLSDDGNLVLQ